MLKYLDNITKKLNEIKKGMENNRESWLHTPENPGFIEKVLCEINMKDKEIETLKKTLSRKYTEARTLSIEKKLILTRIEKRAIGIHADSPEKLSEYGISNK